MLPETQKQVEDLRKRTKIAAAELEQAKQRFGSNNDEFLDSQIRLATNWLKDIETHFIAMLERNESPPRSLAEESGIIGHANFHLRESVLPLVTKISDWSRRFGPNFQSIA